MTSRGPYRRHSTPFKLQLCQNIRSGVIGRRDAQRSHDISANLIQLWLTQFDRGELTSIIDDIQDELPCYGYRRVTHELRRHGFLINHKRISRVMRLAGLGIKPRRRLVRTTDSQHGSPIFPNLYRNTIPDQPDRV